MARRLGDVSDIVRRATMEVYGGRCQYCLRPDANHVDHILAVANGGTSDLTNLTLSCGPCNLRKSDLNLNDGFIEIMIARATAKVSLVEAIIRRMRGAKKAVRREGARQYEKCLMARMAAEAEVNPVTDFMNALFGDGWETDPNPRPTQPIMLLDGRLVSASTRRTT